MRAENNYVVRVFVRISLITMIWLHLINLASTGVAEYMPTSVEMKNIKNVRKQGEKYEFHFSLGSTEDKDAVDGYVVLLWKNTPQLTL